MLESETKMGSPQHRFQIGNIHKRVTKGELLTKSLELSDGYIPPLMRQMFHIGESTGNLERTLLMLADHYDHRLETRRTFLKGISSPLLQLVAAILVIGLVIWIQGILAGPGGPTFDASGLGLSGNRGLLIYFGTVFSIGLVIGGVVLAVRENVGGVHRLIPYAYRLPIIGSAIQTISLSRICWTLSLTLGAGLDAIRSIRMSLASAGSNHYVAGADRAETAIRNGATLTGALTAADVFPHDFLQTMEAAELSGTDAESLEHLAADYDQRAKIAIRVITGAMAGTIWLGVLLFIAFMIVRMFMNYINLLSSAGNI
jgi:type II secretory pathway component PulF